MEAEKIMSWISYTDIVTEDKESISEKRKHINIVAHITAVVFFINYITSFIFYLYDYKVTSIIVMILANILLILVITLVIKREIYSIMIWLKVSK